MAVRRLRQQYGAVLGWVRRTLTYPGLVSVFVSGGLLVLCMLAPAPALTMDLLRLATNEAWIASPLTIQNGNDNEGANEEP